MTSILAIYDLADETVTDLLETENLIEAPNWAPDGGHLVVNGDGALFRVPLDAPSLVRIDSGALAALNNDHGISPDGTRLAVSDNGTGTSCVYTLPATGGAPERITALTPSWWHGWSPDGATLAYTAVRDGHFCIATIPFQGGAENVVVGGPHHYDGPDYTPDGEWIWFNSNREGGMQLWRIRPDGSSAERMTGDERVNWFPHPSPDGRHVLYLAYEAGTEGHPRDRDVELRLIDLESGEKRVLVSLFGGQGTINVPCWSPDARRFAFVRYERSRRVAVDGQDDVS